MSFNLPSVKNKPEHAADLGLQEGSFGVPEVMKNGFASVKSNLETGHPIMQSEKKYHENRLNMNMAILRNTQGLHAPLRIAMELKAAKQVGHLPFLPSHNVMLDSLTGRDLEVGPEDIFNTAEFRETMPMPHAVMEKQFGIL